MEDCLLKAIEGLGVGPREVVVFRKKEVLEGVILDLRMMFLALKTLF